MAIQPHNLAPFRLTLALIDGFAMMSYSSVVEPLRAANLLAGRRLYEIVHVHHPGRRAVSSGPAAIDGCVAPGEEGDSDLVLVVAGGDPATFRSQPLFDWLRRLARRGVRLGGVSGGPVIVAAAGLMANRRMTVHWEHAEGLKEVAPDLLIERSLYVIDRDRVTCAGGIAPLDMMHALITERQGAAFARAVSDWFMHTDVRPSGGPQRAGLVERYAVTSPAMLAAIEAMENNIATPLSLAQLARLANVSQRQLTRLFTARLGVAPMAFYRRLRLDKARNLLTQSPLSITEIALASGFAGSAHFAAAYKSAFGHPPRHERASLR